jgi:hypothetical protein
MLACSLIPMFLIDYAFFVFYPDEKLTNMTVKNPNNMFCIVFIKLRTTVYACLVALARD